MQLPPTVTRVPLHTASKINASIERNTSQRLEYLSHAGSARRMERLRELDREWDTERVLETNAASIILAGLMLGKFSNRKWYFLSGAVSAFLLQHALQGWCPPLPLIRRMGVRTAAEIEAERKAILAMMQDDADKQASSSIGQNQ